MLIVVFLHFIFVSSFQFWSSFLFWSSFFCCSSFVFFLHSFAFRHHSSPFCGLSSGFILINPFYTFSPAHHRVIRDAFIFNHFVIFLPRAPRFWVGIFYPQAIFALRSFTDILPKFIKTSLGAGSSSLRFAGLYTDPQNTGPTHLFLWFTVIHNRHYQNNSFLNSIINYRELLVVKV